MASKIHRLRLAGILQAHGSVYLGTYLETVPAYSRTEMYMEVFGTGPQGRSETFDTFLEDSRDGPAPPSMEKADRPSFRIDQENRNTVGNRDAQEDSLGPADMSVRIRAQDQIGPIGRTQINRRGPQAFVGRARKRAGPVCVD